MVDESGIVETQDVGAEMKIQISVTFEPLLHRRWQPLKLLGAKLPVVVRLKSPDRSTSVFDRLRKRM